MKKIILLIFLLTFNFSFYSQTPTKEIRGIVRSYLDEPLKDVNITIKGTTKGTKTDEKGEYTLNAKIGDLIEFSFIGYKTVTVVVEEITDDLNIKMEPLITELDEVVLDPVKETGPKMDINSKIYFSNGRSINPMLLPRIKNYPPDRIQKQYLLLSDGLKFYLPEGLPTENFDLDGVFSVGEPRVDLSTILNVYYIPDASMLYPEYLDKISNPDIIVIRTTNSKEYKEQVAEKYTNHNYYEDDAVTSSNENTFSSTNIETSPINQDTKKIIRGKVTYLDAPLPLVNVVVVGKYTGTKTNAKGEYSIEANVNDILQFSYVGYATVSIIVEDVTEILDIEMVEKRNELNEVTVIANNNKGKAAERAEKREEEFSTAMGNIDPKISGFASAYIDGDEITPGARDILDVLNGKVSGITVDLVHRVVMLRSTGSILNATSPIWDVDNVIMYDIPLVEPNNIKAIYILKSLGATTRYGSQARGGVIVVKTRSGNFSATNSNASKIAQQYTNKDFYANDANTMALSSLNSNIYADALEALETKQKAFIYYDEKLKEQLPSYVDHIAIAQKFAIYFKDTDLSAQILKGLMDRYATNPEIMKAIAYTLQTIGKRNETIEAYERTFKLRPKYGQSYRDLANAYFENDQFKRSWRLYMSYVLQFKAQSEEGIGEMVFNEMEWLYFFRKDRFEIKENFVPKSEKITDFRNDVRIVIEWNTSEAEFDLEFVNPELRSYVFKHTLADNQELIIDEKLKGYSSKEYFIEDLKDGEWLINMTYKGNKKPAPTYFKITTFYNWGKPNQTKQVEIYKFQDERDKIQLKRFNKEIILAKN